MSNEDIDEDVICIDYDWINDEIITSSKVGPISKTFGDSSILLTIEFLSEKRLLLFCSNSDGECKLELVYP